MKMTRGTMGQRHFHSRTCMALAAAAEEKEEGEEYSPLSEVAGGGGNELHPTTKIEVGSSRRNIQRKRTDNAIIASSTGRYNNRSKRMGSTGKGMRADDDPIHHALSYADDRDSDHGTGAVGAINPNDPLYVPEEDDDPRSYVLSSGRMMVGKANASIDVDVSNATVPSGTYDAIVVDDDDDVVRNGRRRPVYGPDNDEDGRAVSCRSP